MREVALIAIDPGTDKVGLCFFDRDGGVIERVVMHVEALSGVLSEHPQARVVMGDGTGGVVVEGREVTLVDERGSTDEGREAWRKAHPVLRILEIFGYAPPSDGYAAEVIGRRAMGSPPGAP